MSNVFVLMGDDGKLLPPAVQATVLAKYSRSPLSAKELVQSVTTTDAEAFQEKWGVTYGHSSIAELAVMPYCFEGVSIIASKSLERYQRAGYSEKSTRYQVFSEESFVIPPTAHHAVREAANILYACYREMEKPFSDYIFAKMMDEGATLTLSERVHHIIPVTVKARAFDNLRYLLPAGTGTNLAAVLNARDARYMMSDLLGSSNLELRHIGRQMLQAAKDVAPVFAMGTKENAFEPKIVDLSYETKDVFISHAHIYESIFWERVNNWYGMSRDQFDSHMQTRGKQPVPELFKTVPISFDFWMDYGAFRDLQRHRRCEQFVDILRSEYPFEIPDDIKGSPFEDQYISAMELNKHKCNTLIDLYGEDPELVQYALPLGTLHHSHFRMDMKELYYITELRTQPQGHISYRRIAWNMAEMARSVYPSLMKWNRAIRPDSIGEHA